MDSTKGLINLQLGSLAAVESLHWWTRVGVTDALDDTPHDRFAHTLGGNGNGLSASHAAPMSGSLPTASEMRSRAPQDGGAAKPRNILEDSTHGLARGATDLKMLRSIMAEFDGCPLKRTATQLVFADGVPGSRVMFVGEAPGEEEDRTGRPFVGKAGRLLDRMLGTIGLDRERVYIANVVPWRPPGNRTPTPEETQVCLPFIERQIDLADPEYLVCLGASATRTILGVRIGIMRARGSWFSYSRQSGGKIPALAMLHPAFLLRQPAHKRFAWADLRGLAGALNTSSGCAADTSRHL